MSDNFLEAMIEKLEEAKQAEGQFKDVKITEVLVHMKIEASEQTYADLLQNKMDEIEGEA